ncbi:MAG: FG-GAP-like repeat-containing protein [Planctomycetota bacterium]
MNTRSLLGASLFLTLLACDVAAQSPFTISRTARLPTILGRLDDVTAGDIDGDGDLDLVIANDLNPNVVLVNDGNAIFSNETAARLVTPRSHATYEADLVDIDGDGDLDLLMVNDDWLPNLVYLNDGRGFFTDVSATALPANADYSTDQVVGDFDGDGDLDWFVANTNSSLPVSKLYLNNGAGVFVDGTTGRLPGQCLADRRSFAADLDQDGDLDLVLNTGGNYLRIAPTVLLNDGRAVFTRASLTLAGTLCYAADVDGDGRLDLLDDDGKQVRRSLGGGNFAAPVAIANASFGTYAAIDHDGDGDPDLIGPNGLFVNDGTGNFTLIDGGFPSAAVTAQNLCIADLDGDGDDDFVSSGCIGLGGPVLNFFWQLDASTAPHIASWYDLDMHVDTAVGPVLIQPVLSFGPAAIPLPPLGILRLDPARTVTLPLLQTTSRLRSVRLPIPNVARMVGTSLYFQALFVPAGAAPRLSNALRDIILP